MVKRKRQWVMERVDGRLLAFRAKDNVNLEGFLFGSADSRRCIVYVHGMTGNFYKHMELQFGIARKAGEAGFSLFSMNTRGHDIVSSMNVSGRKKDRLVAGTDLERFEDSWMDIDGAIRMLARMGFREFVLAGHSTGCQKVVYYQRKRMHRNVIGMLLLAPADDYAVEKRDLGRDFDKTVRLARRLVKEGKGDEPSREVPSHLSPRRFLSRVDRKNVEARIFNYGGRMVEFASVRVPVCAAFGLDEEYACMPVLEYLKILRRKTGAESFVGVVVDGTGHSFRNREQEIAEFSLRWLRSLRNRKPMNEIVELNPRFPLALLGYS